MKRILLYVLIVAFFICLAYVLKENKREHDFIRRRLMESSFYNGRFRASDDFLNSFIATLPRE